MTTAKVEQSHLQRGVSGHQEHPAGRLGAHFEVRAPARVQDDAPRRDHIRHAVQLPRLEGIGELAARCGRRLHGPL